MIHCLHGAVGSFRAWETLSQDLNESVNALDLWRLFDRSTPTLVEAGRVISEGAEFGDVILGYSMGGRLALHALTAAPEKMEGRHHRERSPRFGVRATRTERGRP